MFLVLFFMFVAMKLIIFKVIKELKKKNEQTQKQINKLTDLKL